MPKTSDTNTNTERALLEGIVRGIVGAVNKRDFDLSCPVWNYMAPNFTAQSELGTVTSKPGRLSLEEFLRVLEKLALEAPSSETNIHNMEITFDRSGAQVFVNLVATGLPVGVKREASGIFQFQWRCGRWQIMSYRDMRGFDLF